MPRFVESVKIENGKAVNLLYHNRRFNDTITAAFGKKKPVDLDNFINVPAECSSGIFKCRIIYSSVIEKIEFIPYIKRSIITVKLVYDDNIEYGYKFEDKSPLENLKSLHSDYDDILIVKNGAITDTSFSNVALFDGKEWHTPEIPLLKGTMREKLISTGMIKPFEIRPVDLVHYEKISFINAMLELDESSTEIKNIF